MLTADRRVEEVDARGRVRHRWHQVRKENHYKDSEELIKVAAIVTKTSRAGLFVAIETAEREVLTVLNLNAACLKGDPELFLFAPGYPL